MLLDDAPTNLQRYNRRCLHYNLVADAVYRERRRLNAPFSQEFEQYLVAALLSFDMGRMMGSGLRQRYDVREGGFARRLHEKLQRTQPVLESMVHHSLLEIDISKQEEAVVNAYDILASGGEGRLSEEEKEFHVGATKILHFLNPELFMMIDGNIAATLRTACGIPYRNSTQPGYSGQLYARCLLAVRKLIEEYGVERFRALEWGTPLLRIFDKVAFVRGIEGQG